MKIVSYEKKMGEYTLPDGLREALCGRPIEEQTEFYRGTGSTQYERTAWTSRTETVAGKRLADCSEVLALIVDEGLLVGVIVENDCGNEQACFADCGVCTYYACDNNGAGYIEREDYFYLVAVPAKEA